MPARPLPALVESHPRRSGAGQVPRLGWLRPFSCCCGRRLGRRVRTAAAARGLPAVLSPADHRSVMAAKPAANATTAGGRSAAGAPFRTARRTAVHACASTSGAASATSAASSARPRPACQPGAGQHQPTRRHPDELAERGARVVLYRHEDRVPARALREQLRGPPPDTRVAERLRGHERRHPHRPAVHGCHVAEQVRRAGRRREPHLARHRVVTSERIRHSTGDTSAAVSAVDSGTWPVASTPTLGGRLRWRSASTAET